MTLAIFRLSGRRTCWNTSVTSLALSSGLPLPSLWSMITTGLVSPKAACVATVYSVSTNNPRTPCNHKTYVATPICPAVTLPAPKRYQCTASRPTSPPFAHMSTAVSAANQTHAMTGSDEKQIESLLQFWFGSPGADGLYPARVQWFQVSAAFDAEIRQRYENLHYSAAAGELDHWAATPQGSLALIILLDQFPRNLFRGTAQAFATDAKALQLAKQLVDSGQHKLIQDPMQRSFVYLAFEHSEQLEDQQQAVALCTELGNEQILKFAIQHMEIVQRFGRFPHRNAVLGRVNTAEEEEFLKLPGGGFGQTPPSKA